MTIYIDPAYPAYYDNRLFDANNEILNRDDTLAPFIRMKAILSAKNKEVMTADFLHQSNDPAIAGDYYSFGLLNHLDDVIARKNIRLKAFVISEPPVVAPELYQALPKLTQAFEHVYVHNVVGDGYSLKGVASYKLKQWYWPQPHAKVIDRFWNQSDRKHRVVVINGNHKPKSFAGELYSTRIITMVALSRLNVVDLYGRGWEKWYSRASLWRPYWQHRRRLMSIYHGPCESKLEVLSQYDFCLCFENMQMLGYVTEKLFDCLYAGTIPIYLGAPDIEDLIPKQVYIDFRQFEDIKDLNHFIMSLSAKEILRYKEAGRDFLQSQTGLQYYHALNHLFGDVV